MSSYQAIKAALVDFFHLPREGFHIVLGFFFYFCSNYFFRTRFNSYRSLIFPLCFAIGLELIDSFDNVFFGVYRGFRELFFDSLGDVLLTLLLPFVSVVYFRYLHKREGISEAIKQESGKGD